MCGSSRQLPWLEWFPCLRDCPRVAPAAPPSPWWGLNASYVYRQRGFNASGTLPCPAHGGYLSALINFTNAEGCAGHSKPTRCEAHCQQHGTCNEAYQRCDCPVHMHGSDCSIHKVRARSG